MNNERDRTPHKQQTHYLATDGVVKVLRLARGCETDDDRHHKSEYKCQSASVHFAKRFLVWMFEGSSWFYYAFYDT